MAANPSADTLAGQLVDTTLQILCAIRTEMRTSTDLTMAQFRTLMHLHRSAGTSLSELADDVGVSPPAMSKLIDGLVERNLVARTPQAEDRRRVELVVSPEGRRVLDRVRQAVRARLAERLATLSAGDRGAIAAALTHLDNALDAPEVLA
ncbi:MAG: MarR family transcriptional regulator [bacterium]